jgi:uncharacterized lipoprotein YmbA
MMTRIVVASSLFAALSLSACVVRDTKTVYVQPSPPQTVVVPSSTPTYAVAPAQVVVAPPYHYETVVVPQQGVAVVCPSYPSYQTNCYTTSTYVAYTVEEPGPTDRDHR